MIERALRARECEWAGLHKNVSLGDGSLDESGIVQSVEHASNNRVPITPRQRIKLDRLAAGLQQQDRADGGFEQIADVSPYYLYIFFVPVFAVVTVC